MAGIQLRCEKCQKTEINSLYSDELLTIREVLHQMGWFALTAGE